MHFVQAGKYTGAEVRHLRMKFGMTQSDLAAYLNVSPKTVESWEHGSRQPSGSVCRLLDLLRSSGRIPFSRPRHYLHGHAFAIPSIPCTAAWIDGKRGLAISILVEGKKVRIPFPQELPNDEKMQPYHDAAGMVAVKEYVHREEEKERLRGFIAKIPAES